MSLFQELWQSANPSSAPGGDASSIAFTPAGSIAATTVQAAIEEVAAESAPASAATVRVLAGPVEALRFTAAVENGVVEIAQ